MREKRTTIKDVAEKAGVSIATVSRVLSNADYPVSAALRGSVEATARELGFAYTVAPRQSRSSDSREIALVIPNISNPFYMQTIQGVSSVCYDKKYQLVICNSQRDTTREAYYLQDLYNRKINGVIISSITNSPNILTDYIERGMKMIQLDQRAYDDRSFNINYDSRVGAHLAVRHLISKGHRRIAFASTPLTRWTRKEIYKGYLEGLAEANIAFDEGLVFTQNTEEFDEWDNYEVLAGNVIAEGIINSGCNATAVFCVNDMVAFGVISGLEKQGVKVPDNISIVGFDDNPFAEAFVPPLTTIHCPAYETGRLSALMLIDSLESGGTAVPLTMQMQPTLVERRSVKDIRE